MGVDIGDGTISFTAYLYNFVKTTRYALKVKLNIPIQLGLDSKHYDLFFRIKEGDLMSDGTTLVIDFLDKEHDTLVLANSTYKALPDGTYYVETISIREAPKRKGVYDVQLSVFGV